MTLPGAASVSGLRIRSARPSDAKALVELAQAVGAEGGGWLVSDGHWRTIGEERRHLRAIGRSPHAAVIVAETGEAVVGRLTVVRDANPACRHVADLGLMVAREWRRRGIGRALLAAAEHWAAGAEVRKLELHVFPHNDAAIALYEAAGYLREGHRRLHFQRGAELVDAVLMAKLL